MFAALAVLLLGLLAPVIAGPGSIPGADAGGVDLPADPAPTQIAEIDDQTAPSTSTSSTSTSTEGPGENPSSTSSSSTSSSTSTSTDAPGDGDSWNYYGRNGGGNNDNRNNLERTSGAAADPEDNDDTMVIVLAVVFALATTGLVVYGVIKHFEERQPGMRTLISFVETSTTGSAPTEIRVQQFADAFDGTGGLHADDETASHAESSLYDAEALYCKEHAVRSSRISAAAGGGGGDGVPPSFPCGDAESDNLEHAPRLSERLPAGDQECLDLDCDADTEA